MKVNNNKYTMTSNKTICEHKLMKSEKYTGSFLLIEIMQVALRPLFFNQNLCSKAFLLPKLQTFLFQYVKNSIFS